MRLFFGLPAGPAGREFSALLRKVLEREAASRSLSWVPSENLHLTISFIGEVDAKGLQAARGALAEVSWDKGPIVFKPGGLAFFPGRGKPRVLVVEPWQSPEGISELHTRLCAALARAARTHGLVCLDPDWPDADVPGSRPRRPFRAHLTIARFPHGRPGFRPDRDCLEQAREALSASESLLLGPLTLFESQLLRSGVCYRPL